MNVPFFDDSMEQEVGSISVKKLSLFIVEQSDVVGWNSSHDVTFSDVIVNRGWSLNLSTGMDKL